MVIDKPKTKDKPKIAFDKPKSDGKPKIYARDDEPSYDKPKTYLDPRVND